MYLVDTSLHSKPAYILVHLCTGTCHLQSLFSLQIQFNAFSIIVFKWLSHIWCKIRSCFLFGAEWVFAGLFSFGGSLWWVGPVRLLKRHAIRNEPLDLWFVTVYQCPCEAFTLLNSALLHCSGVLHPCSSAAAAAVYARPDSIFMNTYTHTYTHTYAGVEFSPAAPLLRAAPLPQCSPTLFKLVSMGVMSLARSGRHGPS
jgi:hypothetical protein